MTTATAIDDHMEAHGSLKDYSIGFILSVILTAIPFWLVMTHQLAPAPPSS
jgi:cytochrome o ubiquinol oxidase operon protein cyoD